MNPKTSLLEYKDKVDAELEIYFQRKLKEYGDVSDFVSKFIQDFAEFTLRGGKRFRAALIYYAYKLLGGTDDKEIIKLSMFIELMESFLLIHDDIIDRSKLRRNGPTMHKIYEEFSAKNQFMDDIHFGVSMAILAGDLGAQLAFEVVKESNFSLENKNKLIDLISKQIQETIFGEAHDVLLSYGYPKDYSDKDILITHRYKTATYTYKLPLFAGAILADATDEELKALEGYAMAGGISFQIWDDVLGAFGEANGTGKEIKNDFIEGKKTLLITQAYKNANMEQREILDKYLGRKDLSDLGAERLRNVIRQTGALEYSKMECSRQVEKAKKALDILSDRNADAYNYLVGIADYMIIRNH